MPDEEDKVIDVEASQAQQDAIAVQGLDDIPEPEGDPDPFAPPSIVERGAQAPAPREEEPITEAPVVPPAEAPAVPPQASFKSQEDLDKELELIQPRPNDNANVVKGIAAMKEKVREINEAARKVAEEKAALETKAKELEEKAGKLPEGLEARMKELEEFRRMKDIESDPVFQQKFNQPIQQLETETLGLLKTWDLPEEVEKFIQEQGGVSAVRYSTEQMPGRSKGQEETKAAWFKRAILDNLEDFQREDLEENLRKARQLVKTRDSEVQSAKSDSTKWEQQRQAEIEKQTKDNHSRASKARDEMLEKLGPVAQKWEAKPGAPQEEQDLAKWHNETLAESNKIYEGFVGNFDPEVEVQKSILAAQAHYLASLASRNEAEIKSLREQLAKEKGTVEKIKHSGRTARDSNAPVTKGSQVTDLFKVTDQQAMSELDKL